jgi:DNA (cytosine-5)-methyltransferase 1
VKTSRRTVVAADLFAGAGGTSTALRMACEELGLKLRLTAVNHWPIAVETHAANHPEAEHLCETLDSIDPRKAIGKRLDVLMASPECTHHSNARGGKPCSDQSRATAWHVIRWAEALRPRVILVENVREMLGWGPLGSNGRPLKRQKGVTFTAWLHALESVGYTCGYRLVNAADYGGATTRTRLFVAAVRGRGPVRWPVPTHERKPEAGLFGSLKPWRAAREVIDWSLAGRSIFGRKHPLKPNTIERIAEGIRRFWKMDPEPFLVRLRGTSGCHLASSALSVSEPIPTLTSSRNIGLCEPFLLGQQSGAVARRVSEPIPTVAGAGAISLIQPFLMSTTHQGDHGQRVRSVEGPLPTITGANRGEHALIEPFLTAYHNGPDGARRNHSLDEPLPTLDTSNRYGVVEPFMVPTNFGERDGQRPRTHDIAAPLPTLVGSSSHAVVSPFLVKYYGTGVPQSVDEPLDTITALDRFGLVTPTGAVVADILFRMLQPHELAAGMGFPAGYKFSGTREQVVKQIGNAVEVNKARAHLRAFLLGDVA